MGVAAPTLKRALYGNLSTPAEKEAKYFCKICDKMVLRGRHKQDYHDAKDGNLKCPKCGKILANFESGWFYSFP